MSVAGIFQAVSDKKLCTSALFCRSCVFKCVLGFLSRRSRGRPDPPSLNAVSIFCLSVSPAYLSVLSGVRQGITHSGAERERM